MKHLMRMFGNIFVSKNVLDMSVASAVVAFNDGASGALEIMKKGGLSAGYYNKWKPVAMRSW